MNRQRFSNREGYSHKLLRDLKADIFELDQELERSNLSRNRSLSDWNPLNTWSASDRDHINALKTTFQLFQANSRRRLPKSYRSHCHCPSALAKLKRHSLCRSINIQ